MAILALLALPLALVGWVFSGLCSGVEWLVRRSVEEHRAEKRARIEAELDRKHAELRQTILQLASAMNGDALEARKALIRESYLARGEVPKA